MPSFLLHLLLLQYSYSSISNGEQLKRLQPNCSSNITSSKVNSININSNSH